jgi:acyl-CoA thioesterase
MNPNTTSTLSELLLRRERADTDRAQRVRFHAPADWSQGRTTFGGLLSALAVQAMRDVCGNGWPLRALQTNFVGPIEPGQFTIEVQLLRQGKNIRQVQARVVVSDAGCMEQTSGVMVGVFGLARASTLPTLSPQPWPVASTIEEAFPYPYVPDVMPAFTQHLDFRHAEGGLPYSGSKDWHSRVYVRLKQTGDVDHELQAVLLADAGPTPALAQMTGFTPSSTVSWALELRPVSIADHQGFWRMDKDALATGEGYVNEKTTLWTPCGQLAAFGYQVVAVYG